MAASTSAIRSPDARRLTPSWRGGSVAALLSAVAFALSGCGSTGSTPGAPSTGASVYQRLVSAYVEYARCARGHGMPNLPDPQVDDQGNDHYPALDRLGPWSWPQSVLTGCATDWDHVHTIRDEFDSQHAQNRPPSIISIAQERALAQCIRRHGFPTYPDPGQNGSSPAALPPGFSKPNLSPQALAAISACRQPHPS